MRFYIFIFSVLIVNIISAQELKPFRSDSLFGYKDSKGIVIIKPQFQYATKFYAGYAIVAKNEKFGVINNENEKLLDFKYEFLRHLDSTEVLYGRIAEYFGEFFWGVITLKGEIKIQDKYSYIEKRNNHYIVQLDSSKIISKDENGAYKTIDSKYGMLDSEGKELIPCIYHRIEWKTSNLLEVNKELNGNYALFDKNGKQLTDFEYMVFGDFNNGIAKARIENKFGFINEQGKIVIPIKYDYCNDFENGISIVKMNERFGAINQKGEEIVKPIYQYDEVVKKISGK